MGSAFSIGGPQGSRCDLDTNSVVTSSTWCRQIRVTAYLFFMTQQYPPSVRD